MIKWPEEDKLTEVAQKNMGRFKVTALAKELEEDTHTWTLTNWSWTKDAPHKWTLRDDARRGVSSTMDQSGQWTVTREG